MGAEQEFRGRDGGNDVVNVRHAPRGGATACHAVSAHQAATSGTGTAIHAVSDNTETAPIVARGAGDLINLQDTNGVSRFRVGQTGALTVGDVVGVARTVYKTADEQVTSSATVQDDDHLTLTVVAGGVYAFEGCLLFDSADANADLRLTFVGPSGATGWWAPVAITLGNADGSGSVRLTKFDLAAESTMGAISGGSLALPRGYLAVSATAGSFKLQWAQASSSGTAVTVRAGSWLRLHRMA